MRCFIRRLTKNSNVRSSISSSHSATSATRSLELINERFSEADLGIALGYEDYFKTLKNHLENGGLEPEDIDSSSDELEELEAECAKIAAQHHLDELKKATDIYTREHHLEELRRHVGKAGIELEDIGASQEELSTLVPEN